tara:strand:+ start:38919 stop:39371 length:453 start_codon:yes stop_codon:yes gene_type:complete
MSSLKWIPTLAAALVASASLAGEGIFPPVEQLNTICADTSHLGLCEATRVSFKTDYEAARRGDYPAQRNVAFCLYDGCDGAVLRKPVESCAWRMVIQGSKAAKEPTERESYRNACSRLSNADRKQSLARAEAMFGAIYQAQLPLETLLAD